MLYRADFDYILQYFANKGVSYTKIDENWETFFNLFKKFIQSITNIIVISLNRIECNCIDFKTISELAQTFFTPNKNL